MQRLTAPLTLLLRAVSITTSGISYLSSVSTSFLGATALPSGASGTSYRSSSEASVLGSLGSACLGAVGCTGGGGGLAGGGIEVSGISYLSSDMELCTECFPDGTSRVSVAEVSDGVGVGVALAAVVTPSNTSLGGNAGGESSVGASDSDSFTDVVGACGS